MARKKQDDAIDKDKAQPIETPVVAAEEGWTEAKADAFNVALGGASNRRGRGIGIQRKTIEVLQREARLQSARLDLTPYDLPNDLRGIDLRSADLPDDITGVDFSDANLQGASLPEGAKREGAVFEGADIRWSRGIV
jgi:uncharacterized protein YjbI with pentapeptide repeats